MPPKFGGAPACVKCQKSVYAAEQITGPGGLWHKACFNCKECNRKLDSTNLTERNNEAYCKTCYGKLFGPKGMNRFAEIRIWNNMLNMDTVVADHQKFGGSSDNISTASVSTLSNSAVVAESTSGTAPVISQASAIFEQKAKLSTPAVTAGGCPRCSKQVYFAEQILGPGGVKYHKLCFRCSDCGKSLDSTNMADKDSVLFCKTCHSKKFGPKGYGFGVGAGTLSTTQ
ncbi:hypothetical protein BDR26DRAFT_853637 [Obelidium mucronatum]|nr:hypothetical protein BDR26DRAFT_853637 [Obelidium mucronatum]